MAPNTEYTLKVCVILGAVSATPVFLYGASHFVLAHMEPPAPPGQGMDGSGGLLGAFYIVLSPIIFLSITVVAYLGSLMFKNW